MLRRTLLWLSRRRSLSRFAGAHPVGRAMARRFVAGETLDQAVAAVRALNREGLSASLDLLGEGVSRLEQAAAARDQVLVVLDRIAADVLEANVSVKLSQLGIDLSTTLCRDHMLAILDRAARHGIFVRIDMESSAYTERTLELFYQELHPRFGELVGVVIQSALRRSAGDLAELLRVGARVRLVKGAYLEPATLAFSAKRDVDAAFARLAERLLAEGSDPAFATHDERLIGGIQEQARRQRRTPDRFEFQMLYGVRRDLQRRLQAQGYRVRIYVPFGEYWYPYLMRRLAERPANLAFLATSVLKEAVARR